MTPSVSFLCFDKIIAFLFNPTCTLLSLRCVCDINPARYSVELWETDGYNIR